MSLLSGFGVDSRSAAHVQGRFADRVVEPLMRASLDPTGLTRGADPLCDTRGKYSEDQWMLNASLVVDAPPPVVAAALRGSLAVVKPSGDGTYVLQESLAEPLGWFGDLEPDGLGGTVVRVGVHIDLRGGRPHPSWTPRCGLARAATSARDG